jgi:hypothetical protein
MDARLRIWSLMTDRHSWQLVPTSAAHPVNTSVGSGGLNTGLLKYTSARNRLAMKMSALSAWGVGMGAGNKDNL